MTLSITENIPNIQQSPNCKQFIQVGFHREVLREESWGSVKVAKVLAQPEYEKYSASGLEQKSSHVDEDLDNVAGNLKTKNGGKE